MLRSENVQLDYEGLIFMVCWCWCWSWLLGEQLVANDRKIALALDVG